LERFRIPIIESLFLGLSTIASVGGKAEDDYMSPLASKHLSMSQLVLK
jgi:hypothetical protein